MKVFEILESSGKHDCKECKGTGKVEGAKCNHCDGKGYHLDEAHGNSKVYDKCWKGYRKVKGKKRGEKGSCVKEDVGITSSSDVSVVINPTAAKSKPKKKGRYGAPKAPQATNSDGTAKNALDINANVMGGKAIKR